MSHKRPVPAKAAEPVRPQQVSGAKKDQVLRGLVQEVPDVDEAMAAKIGDRLCGAINFVGADRSLIEHHTRPKAEIPPKPKPFDPYAFSLMKVFRIAGERGLREKLREIEESSHLQALANAQKISLPIRLRADGADATGLKEAIVSGVIRRHEDWQAAS